MDQSILIAIITTFGSVIVGGFSLLGVMLAKTQGSVKETRKLAAEAKEQVTNSHAANFRDEVTGIGDNASAIKIMLEQVGETLDNQDNSLKELHTKVNTQGQRISELTVSDKAQWTRLDARDAKEKER